MTNPVLNEISESMDLCIANNTVVLTEMRQSDVDSSLLQNLEITTQLLRINKRKLEQYNKDNND